MYKVGRQQEINFRFTCLPRLFHCTFSDKIITLKKKNGKENYLVIIVAIRQELQKIFPQVKVSLVDLFESLPHVLANNRENNTNKSYINYFIKCLKWENQFPEVNATPAEEIYVILNMLSLFQNNKSYPVIGMSYYAIKYFNEFFKGDGELGSHFINNPVNTSTLNQLETVLIINVHQRCFNVDIWFKMKVEPTTFIDVVSTLTKQR